MRLIQVLMTAVLALVMYAAQAEVPAVANMHGGLQSILSKLKLTPSQDQEIKQILMSERRQLREAGGNADEEKSIRAEGREQISSVLTPEQKWKLKRLMKQKAAANKGNSELQEEASGW